VNIAAIKLWTVFLAELLTTFGITVDVGSPNFCYQQNAQNIGWLKVIQLHSTLSASYTDSTEKFHYILLHIIKVKSKIK